MLLCFLVSKETRVEFLLIKLKDSVKYFTFKYFGLYFVTLNLSYKKWLSKDEMGELVGEAVKVKMVEAKI